jgi:hypothetical protein
VSLRSEDHSFTRKDDIDTLALYIQHSFPLLISSIDLLDDLERGRRIPKHLAVWTRTIDFNFLRELKECLIARREMELQGINFNRDNDEDFITIWNYFRLRRLTQSIPARLSHS